MRVGIINYNMGNLHSVLNAFKFLNITANVTDDPKTLSSFDKIILPGVGAFGDAMNYLKQTHLDDGIMEYSLLKRPILGICLGMQLLFDRSFEFGTHEGLHLIEGDVVPFDKTQLLGTTKVPHMGWNKITLRNTHPLFKDLNDPYLYFVHSFHVQTSSDYTIGTTHYDYPFTSAVQKQHIYGIQPHPEKSHRNGLALLKNFVWET